MYAGRRVSRQVRQANKADDVDRYIRQLGKHGRGWLTGSPPRQADGQADRQADGQGDGKAGRRQVI